MKLINKKILWAFAALVIIIAACGLWTWLTISQRYEGPERRIFIPANATEQAVTDTLQNHLGAFGKDVAMMWKHRRADLSMAHGSYVVSPGDRAWSVAGRLATGRQTPVKVTFNNIRLLSDLATRVSGKMEFSTDEFLAATDSVLKTHGFSTPEEYPAAFVPDTYEFYWTASAAQVVERLNGYRNDFWTAERRRKAEQLGLSTVQVATLASIVEEETTKADERPKVARLYLNRLNKGMLLQADPTVKFALGNFALRRIGGAMLRTESPYNTYVTKGLPPGPIRVVERASMDAVLNAPEHPYIYMCAKADFSGYHEFATDYETHRRNAVLYQKKLNDRNIH